MNSDTFRMPAHRTAALAIAAALALAPAVLGASAAHATTDHGRASAVVLRTGLDVSLLNKTVDVPLAVSSTRSRHRGAPTGPRCPPGSTAW